MATVGRRVLGAVALVVVAGVAASVGFVAGGKPEPTPPPTHLEVADTATVLVAIQNLARLESVNYHMERVIDLKERQSKWFGLVQADDAILLVAAGDVIAGIDLAKMRSDDIRIDPSTRSATLVLPEPEVLSARLDSKRTYVHSRKTDMLAKRREQLESLARKRAEQSIGAAALQAGILDQARRNAKASMQTLVQGLGYRDVHIEFRAPDAELR